jgi:hypothetical protein
VAVETFSCPPYDYFVSCILYFLYDDNLAVFASISTRLTIDLFVVTGQLITSPTRPTRNQPDQSLFFFTTTVYSNFSVYVFRTDQILILHRISVWPLWPTRRSPNGNDVCVGGNPSLTRQMGPGPFAWVLQGLAGCGIHHETMGKGPGCVLFFASQIQLPTSVGSNGVLSAVYSANLPTENLRIGRTPPATPVGPGRWDPLRDPEW